MNEPFVKSPSISTKSLLDMKVNNHENEEIGTVDEVMIEQERGFVSNVIITTGGLPGFKKRVAFPWDMIQVDTDNNQLLVNIEKDFLKRIPAYQGDSG